MDKYLLTVLVIHPPPKTLSPSLFIKVRSTGRLIEATIAIKGSGAEVDLLEDEAGISPGQACVFYSKNKFGIRF